MIIIPIAIILLLSLVVLIGGLFLLAYAKKENTGKLTCIAAYVAIIFSSVLFVGGLICALMFHSCHGCSSDEGNAKHHNMRGSHHMGVRGHHGMCQGSYEGCGKKMQGKCTSSASSSRSAMDSKDCKKSGECKKKCDAMKKEQCHESKSYSKK
jgi:hypothetical protein